MSSWKRCSLGEDMNKVDEVNDVNVILVNIRTSRGTLVGITAEK